MNAPTKPSEDTDPPMAEPGKRRTGGDIGGVAAPPTAGVADWAQRSTERGDDTAVGRASTGDAAGGAADPRIDLGGKAAPGSAPGAAARTDRPASDDRATPSGSAQGGGGSNATESELRGENDADDEDPWRHEPVAPVDEPNPLKSLGEAIGDTITGSDADATRRKR